jgi:hypothetical protein
LKINEKPPDDVLAAFGFSNVFQALSGARRINRLKMQALNGCAFWFPVRPLVAIHCARRTAWTYICRQILPAARRAFDRLPRNEQRRVQGAVSKYGFPFDLIRWEPRARGLICMGELRKFSTEVEDHPRPGWAYMPEINPEKLPAPGSGEQSAPGKSRKQPTDVASRPNKPKSKKHDSKLQTKEDAKVGHFMRLVEALDVIINPKFWKSDGDKVRRSQVAHWIGVSIGWYCNSPSAPLVRLGYS